MLTVKLKDLYDKTFNDQLKVVILHGEECNVLFILSKFFSPNITIELEALEDEICTVSFFEKSYLVVYVSSYKAIEKKLPYVVNNTITTVIFVLKERPQDLNLNKNSQIGYILCYFDNSSLRIILDRYLENLQSICISFSVKQIIMKRSGNNPFIMLNEIEKIYFYCRSKSIVELNDSSLALKIISNNTKYLLKDVFWSCINEDFDPYFAYINKSPEPVYILRCFMKLSRDAIIANNLPIKFDKNKCGRSFFLEVLDVINNCEIEYKELFENNILLKLPLRLALVKRY